MKYFLKILKASRDLFYKTNWRHMAAVALGAVSQGTATQDFLLSFTFAELLCVSFGHG